MIKINHTVIKKIVKDIAFFYHAFSIEFATKLHEMWHPQDSNGATHYLWYNMNMLCLVIKDRWSDLAEYYHFEHDHHIIFHYVGDNKFHITIYTGNASPSSVLTFLDAIHRAYKCLTDHSVISH